MQEFYRLTPEQQGERLSQLARVALAHWPLSATRLRLVKYRENAVFEVCCSHGARYALRIHRPGYHSDAELHSELEWMRALQQSAFAVPAIVPSRSGALFHTVAHALIPEPRQIDLFEWIDGEPLGSVEGSSSEDAARLQHVFHAIGQLAARLHAHASEWTPSPQFVRHAWDDAGLVGEQPLWGRFWELPALDTAQRALVLRARGRLQLKLGALPRTDPSYGLIHADFAPENLMVDGEQLRLIDFDDAGYGWRLFELATSLYFHYGQPYYATLRDALIAGYRSQRALPEEELAGLPMFLAARGFTYLGWVHTRPETQTARELTPMLIELACSAARDYLDS